MDVCSDQSVRTCVQGVLKEAGHIDVLVNNAGFLSVGAIEEATLDSARAQMETNFFGAVRVLHAVIPSMRERSSGRIVNMTSLAGIVPLPFWGFYNASSSPRVAHRDAPLRAHAVRDPGQRRGAGRHQDTPLHGRRQSRGPARVCALAKAFRKTDEGVRDCRTGPEVVAEAVAALVHSGKPRPRTTVTKEAVLFTTLKRWTPAGMFESQLRKGFKLDVDRP